MATWQLQTAKAKLSELLRAVRELGPQVISVRGKAEYLVIPNPHAEAEAPVTGLDLFKPVLGIGVELELPPRTPDGHRELWFENPDLTGEDVATPPKPR